MSTIQIFEQVRAAGRGALDERTGKRLLAEFGIPVPKTAMVQPGDVAAAADLTPPLALKVMSPEILHKSDAGGVALRLGGVDDVETAVAEMAAKPAIAKAKVDGYLVEEMAAPGTEVVIGGVNDPQFGPLVMVGLGGIFVEVLKDVAFRICPITDHDAREMLASLKGKPILDGVRGEAGVDQDALVDILLKVGGADGLLMTHAADIAELDINPIIAGADGAVAVDARVLLTDGAGDAAADDTVRPRQDMSIVDRFTPLFAPDAVAVVGASSSQTTIANTFIRRMRDFGYAGNLYPIHPKADEIEGFACYPSLAETPTPVDYAYVAIGADRIPDLLQGAGGNLKFAQVISSGFGEIEGGEDLEHTLVAKAHAGGCRVLGPNCLGMYSPRGGVTFPVGAPTETGVVGVISQSGGLGTDICKRGQWRGLRFSGLVTVGNSADLGPADLLEFYFADDQTKVVGLYIEDVKDGRRFFDLLRSDAATKPVVILRGGRSDQGRIAAASHTGALAGDGRGWEALSHQTGAVLVDTIDEFINALLAFQFAALHPASPTRNVTLFGNGGGTSVLATDFFADLGLDISPFDDATRDPLEALNLPPGTSVANPIDAPVRTLQEQEGRIAGTILETVYQTAKPDAVVMHLNLASFVGRGDVDPINNLISAAEDIQARYKGQAHFFIVLRSDGSDALDAKKREYQQRALAVGIPCYDELAPAAKALAAVSWVEAHMAA